MVKKTNAPLNPHSLIKRLGQTSILGLAIAGANMANALQTDFGVDYRAQAFAVSSEAFGDAGSASDTDTGLAHLVRIKADFKHEGTGVSVHTSTELAGDRWAGDSHGNDTGPVGAYNTGSSSGNVRMDLAYAQVPLPNGSLLRVGRQASNWSNCFLTCDDRRDRISLINPTRLGTILALYDRRSDKASFTNPDNGDMVGLGLVSKLGGFSAGMLYIHWLENSSDETTGNGAYALTGAHLFSPYISGKLTDDVSLQFGITYAGGGSTSTGVPGDDRFFNETAMAEYLRLGIGLGDVQLNVQGVATQDGGLVSGGFDTYSSLINNNPDATASPTSVYRMGGSLGVADFNETLAAVQAVIPVGNQLTFKAAIGGLNVDNGDNDDTSTFVDLQAHYQLNEAVATSLTWGMLTSNEVGTTASNSLVPAGGASFADDDLMAASANLYVKF